MLLLASSPDYKSLLMELFMQRLAVPTAAGTDGAVSCTLAAGRVRVVDFEASLQDSSRRDVALQMIEQADNNDDSWAVVLANSDPFPTLKNGDLCADMQENEKQRWMDALRGLSHSVSGAVKSDRGPCHNLISFGHNVREEQLTLVQVARGGFANPRDEAIVASLLERGLLKWNPNLVLMSRGFESVHKNAGAVELRAREHPTEGIGWHQLRWAFLALLLTGLAFAIGTGQAWLQGATAMLTSLAGGLEGIRRILTAVQRPSRLKPA
jgi:hypothetical protein